jgi:glycosyltransferase involved in cell wall biosynthesis
MLANVVTILKERFECLVACPAGDVVEQFKAAGASVIASPFPICQFTHISGYHRPALHPSILRDLFRIMGSLPAWRRLLSDVRPDIVHLNAVTLLPYLGAIGKLGAKAVCMVQETSTPGLFGVRTSWLKRMLKRADAAVFISQYDRRAWGMGSDPAAHVLPNWVDLEEFDFRLSRDAARIRWNIPANKRVILFMGGVSKLKGTLELLEAFSKLLDVPDLLLLVAGYAGEFAAGNRESSPKSSTPYVEAFRTLLQSRDLAARVQFLGVVKNTPELYAAAEMVVFPATEAHQSRPLIEAGAMKRPVIISRFSQLAEFCVENENCLCVPPGDVPALASAMRKLAGDEQLRERLAENNYLRVQSHHNQEISSRALLDIYSRVA